MVDYKLNSSVVKNQGLTLVFRVLLRGISLLKQIALQINFI